MKALCFKSLLCHYLTFSGSWWAEISLCAMKLIVGDTLENKGRRKAGESVRAGVKVNHLGAIFMSFAPSRLTDSIVSPTREAVFELNDPR